MAYKSEEKSTKRLFKKAEKIVGTTVGLRVGVSKHILFLFFYISLFDWTAETN